MRKRTLGLTLVEAAVLVSVVGIVLAVFLPTFFRQLRTSKIEEASETLAMLAAQVDTYYAADHQGLTACLPQGAGPLPAAPSIEPQEVDFASDATPGITTWTALGFAPERPLRFSYELIVRRPGCDVRVPIGEALYTVRAIGDLDGDGRQSTFERSATLNDDGDPVPLGALHVRQRVE